jgi:selenocysteine-specific elongation factor
MSAGANGVDLASLSEQERAIVDEGLFGVEVRAGRLVDRKVPREAALSAEARRILTGLESGGWSPESTSVADRGALRELERRGLAVQAGQLWFASASVDAAIDVFVRLLDANPEGFTVSEARDALGSSRKYVLALLAYLDSMGLTRRRDDRRIAGARLEGGK